MSQVKQCGKCGSFTDDLRKQLGKRMGKCPTCGEMKASYREFSDACGIKYPTLWRFLSGKHIDSGTIDKIVKYLKGKL